MSFIQPLLFPKQELYQEPLAGVQELLPASLVGGEGLLKTYL